MNLVLLLILLSTNAWADKNICYFSLNNEKEFLEMDKLTQKLNKYSQEKISVHEHQTKGSKPEASFQALVESGVRCDGLVISGHHTGAFDGSRSEGSLGVDFLEKLSCNPQYQGWFAKVSGLWLQGCRTLGVKIETNSPTEQTSDFHTGRVGNVIEEDSLEGSFADLNMEFSATLDQENPLSSRYLRIFPNATVFGWTATAPGVDAKSEFSIPYHIAHVARLNNDRDQLFQDPTKDITPEVAAKYANALNSIIGRLNSTDEKCDENVMVEGWLEHGQATKKKYPFSFNNPDLMAYASLESAKDLSLQKARELDCLLKQNISREAILETVDAILINDKTLGYSFNSLWELLQRAKNESKFDLLKALRAKLENSQVLKHFIMQKLSNKELGILRKMDYYKFYSDLTNEKVEAIEKLIVTNSINIIMKPNPDNNYDLRDFKQTLISSLVKNKFVDKSFIDTLIKSNNEELVINAADSLKLFELPELENTQYLNKMLKHPNLKSKGLRIIASNLSQVKIQDTELFIDNIISNPFVDADTLAQLADLNPNLKPFAEKTMVKILNKQIPKNDNFYSTVISNLASFHDTDKAQAILNKILTTPDLKNYRTNQALLSLASDGRLSVPALDLIINNILDHKNTGDYELGYMVRAIRSSKMPVKDSYNLLKKLMDHPRIQTSTWIEMISTVFSNRVTNSQKNELIHLMMPRISGFDQAEILRKELALKSSSSNTILIILKANSSNSHNESILIDKYSHQTSLSDDEKSILNYIEKNSIVHKEAAKKILKGLESNPK